MLSILRCLSGILAVALTLPGAVRAQAYPTKPIRMIVTAAAGGITDIMTRIMADQIVHSLGQPLIVENRPGAGGSIGVAYVAKSAPDGYTLVIVNVGNVAIAHWISKDLPFDPLNDLAGVAPVAEVPSIAAINARLPVNNLREFIDYARNNPGKINYGSAGNGTMPHLAADLLGYMTGIRMVHVPYKGGAPLAVDLAAGQIQIGFIGVGSMKAQLAAGQVRALAVAAGKRLTALPEVPTFDEAGVAGYNVTNWFGVLAPSGTPREIIQTLNTSIGRSFDPPQVVQRLADLGILPMKESPEEFQKRIISDDAKWRDIVRNAGIKAE